MKITGTFLDEISHDIPHQNWGRTEWAQDFEYMQNIGIQRVILIRCGYRRWLTYPSKVLTDAAIGCFTPSVDLVKMFLELAEAHGMDFYFGTYDSGHFWDSGGDVEHDFTLNLPIIDEVWQQYGHYSAFKGWYLSLELSRRISDVALDRYRQIGEHCKAISNNLPVLMSPYVELKPTATGIDWSAHERDWDAIFSRLKTSVDIVAFQDGHVDIADLPNFLRINKTLADKYGLRSWTNSESFDRDMPIKFLPIKWEKLRLKLEAARAAGIEDAITFEFSHFMSPQSAYLQAGHLYRRYQEYLAESK